MFVARLGKALLAAACVLGYFISAGFTVAMCGVLREDDGLSWGAFLAGVLCIAPLLLFMIASHEYAHAAVARLTGHSVISIDIGSGPKLARWSAGGTLATLHLLPGGGRTMVGGGLRTGSLRHCRWTYAAGPLSNALQAVLAVVLAIYLRGLPAFFATIFALVQLGGVANLLPLKPSDRRPDGSDGWHLWRYRPWGWTARFHRLSVRSDAGDSAWAYDTLSRRRAPRRRKIEWNSNLALHAYRAGLFEESARAYVLLLEQGTADDQTRAMVQAVAEECVLSAALRDGRELDDAQLDRCSVALFDPDLDLAKPSSAAAVGHSRALLQLARGDATAAMESGRTVLTDAEATVQPADRALVLAMTAIAAARAGCLADARDWAEQVPTWCALRPAVQRELASCVPSAVS